MNYDQILLMFSMPGGMELLVIAAVGLLIFGNRLPEVGKSLGRGIVEFKKGLRSINDDIDEADKKNDSDKKKDSGRSGS